MNKTKQIMLAFPAAVTILSASNASAQNLLINGDFEDTTGLTGPTGSAGYYESNSPWSGAGWSTTTQGWLSNRHGNVDSPVGGFLSPDWFSIDEHVPEFVNSPNSNGIAGGMVTAGTGVISYFQSVMVDGMTDYNFSGVAANPSSTFGATGPSNAGAVAIVSYQTLLNGALVNSVNAATLFDQQTSDFTVAILQASGAFDEVVISYSIESLDTGSSMIAVDGFSLVAVPEPTTGLLLGFGSLGLIARRKRV